MLETRQGESNVLCWPRYVSLLASDTEIVLRDKAVSSDCVIT